MKSCANLVLMMVVVGMLAVLQACISEVGKGGETPMDCGEHGSAHDGHCHCDEGFLFDGSTCVFPDDITTVCHEHEEEGEEEHHHGACLCPTEGVCPCDGTVESTGGKSYCVPKVHEH